ncbi:hypothetical protein SteCoe_21029 [Stentor coeruleus]|uniref:Uncharacterized protein n=1 Tax=Stentor coeruleus TaxID=5963 RepID=A0A1R2BR07_9CILI|nr:hypothetical protein SteCoe_21029 [Stentor coeruleus]
MSGKKPKEILIISEAQDLCTQFIQVAEQTQTYVNSNLLFTHGFSHYTKAIIFLFTDDASYEHIKEKSSMTTLPKFIIQIVSITSVMSASSIMPNSRKEIFYQVNLRSKISIEQAMMQISHRLDTVYKLFNIKLSHRGKKILKWSSFLSSFIAAVLSLLLIFAAGILSISKGSIERRWFSNSLLTSGNLTVVMSFVGFYGVKKSGIKEYLNIYSWVLIVNSIYKIILLIVYFIMKLHPDIHYFIVPVMCTSILFEILTSCIIFIEFKIIKTSSTSTGVASIFES